MIAGTQIVEDPAAFLAGAPGLLSGAVIAATGGSSLPRGFYRAQFSDRRLVLDGWELDCAWCGDPFVVCRDCDRNRRRYCSETCAEHVVREIAERWERGEKSLVFTFRVWLGAEPEEELLRREHHPADVEVDRSDQRLLHIHLGELTWGSGDARPDFRTRALAFQAMRRAMLRESILVRILPSLDEAEDEAWGKVLVRHFTSPRRGQNESMLRLVGVFVEDLAAASGDILDSRSARGSLYQAGMRNRSTVDIVKGDTNTDTRSARFQGFNTPLLPEILVCGQVAQDGIDLHRHCSHVVHYDLAWNPATLEQRTGRVDRIGSRTQRLRQLSPGEETDSVEPETAATSVLQGALPGAPDARLEIDTPYLAGTYDERMFEELRIRAQTFEVLLGGELSGAGEGAPAARSDGAATDANGSQDAEGQERAAGLVALPDCVADSLRVDLAIWRAPAPTAHDG